MRRPLLTVGISFALGIWASFFVPFPPLLCSSFFAAVGIIAALLRKNAKVFPVAALCVAAAFGVAALWWGRAAAPLIAAAEEGKTVTAAGIVTEATLAPRGFTLILNARFEDAGLPDTTLRVRGYGELEYSPGDSVLCTVRLMPLTGSQGYYNVRGIFVSSQLVTAQPYGKMNLSEAIGRGVIRLRTRISGNLLNSLPTDVAAIQAGMLLGDRSSLDGSISDAFSRAGTIHLLSVSGMHLSIIIGCLTRLLELLGLGKRPRAILSGMGAICFALLTGFSTSITRALIMTLIVLAADLFSRRGDSLNSLGFSLLVISIARPYWLLSSGLWLSAASTAGIALLYRPLWQRINARYRQEKRLVRALARFFLGAGAISVSAYTFSFPVLLVTNGWVSLVSPLANILITPLTAPALLCGMLCAVLPAFLSAPFAAAAAVCTRLILSVSALMAEIPLAFSLDELWRVIFLAALTAMVILLFRWRADKALWAYGTAALVVVFAAGSSIHALAARNQVELIALDGCSPTVLIRGDSAAIVGTPSLYEIGTLLRYLNYREVRRLDAVIAYDCPEQIGSGLLRLTDRFPPFLVVGPDDDYILSELSAALPGLEVVSCGYAAIDVLGDVTVEVSPTGDVVALSVGETKAVKTGAEYAIMEGQSPPGGLRVWANGTLVWTKQAPPSFEPAGDILFGERRILLDC